MGKLFGKLFKILSYLVEQEEKEWRSNNDIRQEFAYGWLREFPIYLARKRFKRPFLIFLLFVISTFIISLLPTQYLLESPGNFNRSNLISYFTILWGAQATLAALIYPIVISFVSLLLQRRYRAKSFLHIYLHDTAAVPSGLLAIGLIFLMTLQYLFLPNANIIVGLHWLYLDSLFFLLNLSLTGFFIFQTFAYIRPTERVKSFKKYLINEVWPRELKKNLKAYLYKESIQENLLETVEGVDTNINDPSTPSIWTQGYFGGRGKAVIKKDLPKDSELVDVRFRPLSFVAKRWGQRAIKKMAKASENPIGNLNLKFPLKPGSKYSDTTTVCRIVGPVELTVVETWLVKWSFKFKSNNSNSEIQAVDLLEDLKSDALRSLRSGEPQIFEESLEDLVDLIALLIKASTFTNKNDETDNYSRISSQSHPFFGSSAYEDWLRKLNSIFEPATDRIVSNDAYVKEAIFLPILLFYNLEKHVQTDVLIDIIKLPRNLNYRIGDWWSKTLENQGIVEHNECKSATLKPPFGGTYDSILRYFIGKWEQLKNNRFLPREKDQQSWTLFQSSVPLFESHLIFTGQLLLDAIYKGDKKRAQYFLDVLLKWYAGLRNHLARHASSIIKRSSFINIEVINSPLNQVIDDFDIDNFDNRRYEPHRLIFSTALYNLWTDLCCSVLYKLLKDCTNSESLQNTLLAESCNAILEGDEPISDGHSVNAQKPVGNATKLLIALIRQYHSGFHGEQNKYRGRLRQITRKLTENRDSTMITGRVYSGIGQEENLNSLRVGQLLALTLFINKNWDPTKKLESHFEEWIKKSNEPINIFLRRLTEWIKYLANEDFHKYENVYNQFSQNDYSFEEAISYARNGLIELKEKLDLKRIEVLESLRVNEKVISQLRSEVSEEVYNNLPDIFPVPLFTNFDHCNEGLESYFLTFEEREKGWFTDPKIFKRIPTGGRDYARYILSRIINDIISKTISSVNLNETKVNSQQEYLKEIQQYERELTEKGKTPILVINGTSDPAWRWTREYRFNDDQFPDDLEFSRDENIQLDSYRGHLNSTEVHNATTSMGEKTSLLIAKETFKELKFPKEDNLLNITPTKIEDEPTLINLKFSWKFEVNVEEVDALLIKG